MVEVTNVVVFDNSEEASLSLWDMTASSGAAWEPSKSVLLITSPTYNTVQKNSLSLSAVSLVEVDPDVPDATWLRRYAERLAKKRHVNQAFPPGGTYSAGISMIFPNCVFSKSRRAQECPDSGLVHSCRYRRTST